MVYVFADCELDTQLYVLRRADRLIDIRPKVFQVLLYLLEHRDHVVSKHALIEAVWPEQYISDATLADVIRHIRQAVGDHARQPQVIQTRHGHGYRFVAEVTSVSAPPIETLAPETLASDPPDPASPLPEHLPYGAGERKVVTILCTTLGQSSALQEQLGLDALHTLMHTRYDLVKRVVQPYEGMLQPLLGDRVLVVFGIPRTHEDHATRAGLAALAVRAGLEAHRETYTAACQAALTVRIGLHTGWIAVGGTEQTSALASIVIGDTITLAMLLQEHAELGMILCSAATTQLLQDVAHLKAHRPCSLPGQSAAEMTYTLLAQRPVSRPRQQTRSLSPLMGRARDLATLQALLAQACAGQGHVVGIIGEPGIGKSRLLAEFRRRQRRLPLAYFESQCLSYGTTSPYLSVRHLLRHMCAITEVDQPETVATKVHQCLQEVHMPPDVWAPPLLDLLGDSASTMSLATLSPRERKERTFTALLQLCVQSSQQHPLVLAVENLHWMDATSEEWFAALVEHIAGRPILLLGTFRPGYCPAWLGASYVTQLSLARLTPRESLRVLQAVPQAAQLSESLTQELLTKAAGNPFFLEELTRAVVEDGTDHLPTIPDTIQAVLAARIDRLTPVAKHLLRVAAVIGRDVPLPLLESVAALPSLVLHQGLQHLQHAELLYETRLFPTPVYTFKHVLTQEVAYQSLLVSTRQPYHQQIVQFLSERFPETAAMHPERLAHHYTEAGLLEQALPYWQRAGEDAVARAANVEAISHFTKGLEVLQGLPVTTQRHQHELRLQLALSAPLLLRGQVQVVGDVSRRVLELSQELGDSVQYFSGLVGLWRAFFNTGQYHKAQEMGRQCFTLAHHAQEPPLLLEAHMMLGSTCLGFGELLTARSHLQHGAHLYNAQPLQVRVARQGVDPGVVCLCRLASTLWLLGYADQALAAVNQALNLARAHTHAFGLLFALFYAAIVYHRCGREIGVALEYVEAVIALARKHEIAFYVLGGLCFQSLILARQGAPVDLVKLDDTVAACKGQETMFGLTGLYATLAEVYYTCGQIDTGLQVLDEALTIIDTRTERFHEAEVYHLRGLFLLHPAALDVQQAEDCLQRACAIAAHQHARAWELRAVVSLSRLWHQQGKRLAARQRLEQIYGWFTEGFETPDLREAQALLDVLTGVSSE